MERIGKLLGGDILVCRPASRCFPPTFENALFCSGRVSFARLSQYLDPSEMKREMAAEPEAQPNNVKL